jgi:hypothetical protein
MSASSLKKLENHNITINELTPVANIINKDYHEIVGALGTYNWKLKAQAVLSNKKKNKKDVMGVLRHFPSCLLSLETLPEELNKLIEAADLKGFTENEDIEATCTSLLNQETTTEQDIKEFSYKLAASDLTGDKKLVTLFTIKALEVQFNTNQEIDSEFLQSFSTFGFEKTTTFINLNNRLRFTQLVQEITPYLERSNDIAQEFSSFESAQVDTTLMEHTLVEFTNLTNEGIPLSL